MNERTSDQNYEPQTTRATHRAGRAKPENVSGLDPSDDLPADGLRPWETVNPIQEWRESHPCVLCRNFVPQGRQDFEQHIQQVHGEDDKSARKVKERTPCKTHCTWICSVCKAEYYYPVVERDTHGGPTNRSFDRRFAFVYCRHGRYPSHKRAIGKVDAASGPVVFFHEGLVFSPQPEQDDPSLKEFIRVKKPKKEVKRGGRARRVD